MQAVGAGGCEAELGYVWNGSGCNSISGCSCEGADCASLYDDQDACIEAHRSCDRACGEGFGGPLAACLSGEFCSFPSSCGFDDGLGSCRATPTACPPVSPGSEICGCNGMTYPSECQANQAGASMNRSGACDSLGAFRFPLMRASCGPADGRAWDFTLSSSAIACTDETARASLSFEIWHDLNSAPPEQTYQLREDFSADGQARVCSVGACTPATGTVTVHLFAAGEVTRFDYDLTTADGTRFVQADVEGTNWCHVLGRCGG